MIREGGGKFTDRPSDRGGPTKYGITLATLSAWRKKPVTAEDVRNLTEDEAYQIYESLFVTGPGFDKIADERLREHTIDFGVNSGIDRAARYLQALVGAVVDGNFGPKSQAVVNAYPDQEKLHLMLVRDRLRFLGRLISSDHSQAENAAGWINRVTEFMV